MWSICLVKTDLLNPGRNIELFFIVLTMLLQLENTNQENVNKLLAFARQHHLQLTLVDDAATDYYLPGKPLSSQQLNQLIESSRKSGMISLRNGHQSIRDNYNAD